MKRISKVSKIIAMPKLSAVAFWYKKKGIEKGNEYIGTEHVCVISNY